MTKTKQPDFQKIFFDSFSNQKLISYKVRRNSNCIHDVFFLNCLISDAVFNFDDMTQNKKTLTIKIKRFKNENINYKDRDIKVYSAITLTNVKRIRWIMGDINSKLIDHLKFDSGDKIDNTSTYTINKTFVNNEYYRTMGHTFNLILIGEPYNWQMNIEFYSNWGVEIKDLSYVND